MSEAGPPPPDAPKEPEPDETGRLPTPEGEDGGTPPDGEGPAGQGPQPPEQRCAKCDARLDPDQTYCLECGTATPLAPPLRRRGRAALIIAGALALLGIGAGALAYAVSQDNGERTVTVGSAPITSPTSPTGTISPTDTTGTTGTVGTLPTDTTATTPTATSPTGTSPLPTDTGITTVTSPTTPSTAPTTTGETTTEPPTTEPPASGGGSTASDWPSGRSGWTAVVASAKSRSAAQPAERKLSATGEPAGILFSSDFSSLRPGYYVVFSGVFSSRSQAAAQAAKLQSDFPGAYPRQVSP
jgi:hypothetical protein